MANHFFKNDSSWSLRSSKDPFGSSLLRGTDEGCVAAAETQLDLDSDSVVALSIGSMIVTVGLCLPWGSALWHFSLG